MLNELPKYLASSLLFTVLIECVVSILLKIRSKKDLLNVILVNILTNPIVVCFTFFAGFYGNSNIRLVAVLILEIFAFLTEGFIYKQTLSFKKINPFILSLILNAVSYSSGLLINKIIY